ncbi:MAG: glycosyltransferase [Defluviitaleaceae bacterium]|nr:glycosyltransferase [Defluviitaleaceae bacterium]
MIRVLHVLSDSNIGGAGHQMLALLAKPRDGFEVEVALPEGALLIPALQEAGVKCVELPYLAEKSFSFRAVRALRTCMEAYKPDIVHTHAAMSGRLAARLYGKCKVVHTRHSVFDPSLKQRALGRLANWLSDAVIAVSPAAMDNQLALGTRPEKIHVIFNGMPKPRAFTPEERTALREKYGIPQEAFVLAQVARLTEVKGQGDMLTAARDFNQNILLLMAGEGELRPELEARIAAEGIKNVRLLGFIKEVEEVLAVMDAQVSASFGTEATSLALVQGMSIGKPAIVTDYGGNPYVISTGKNGVVVPTCNPAAMAKAINGLCQDGEMYNKLAQGAVQEYESRFTVEEMVDRTFGLYRELLVG